MTREEYRDQKREHLMTIESRLFKVIDELLDKKEITSTDAQTLTMLIEVFVNLQSLIY